MKENFTETLKELKAYKEKHHFTYLEIAANLDVTTRTLNNWVKCRFLPLPIYRAKIRKLIGK